LSSTAAPRRSASSLRTFSPTSAADTFTLLRVLADVVHTAVAISAIPAARENLHELLLGQAQDLHVLVELEIRAPESSTRSASSLPTGRRVDQGPR